MTVGMSIEPITERTRLSVLPCDRNAIMALVNVDHLSSEALDDAVVKLEFSESLKDTTKNLSLIIL